MTGQDPTLANRLFRLHELQFEISSAESIDQICSIAVKKGRECIGIDRLGLWFIDPEDPEFLCGTFGIDEKGRLRDERKSRLKRDPQIYTADFFARTTPYKRWRRVANYDDRSREVGTGDLVVAPLWNSSESLGALSGDNLLTGRDIDDDLCHLTALLARMIAHAVTLRRTEEELRRHAQELRRLALHDTLTGLLNRRAGIDLLQQQISSSCRTKHPLSLCFLDLDRLKRVNDQQGHATGDEFLRTVTALILQAKRDADIAARMGGDEMMLIFPGTVLSEAERMIGRLLELSGESESLNTISPPPWFSFGLAEFDPGVTDCSAVDSSAEADRLINEADMRMYLQKREHGIARRGIS